MYFTRTPDFIKPFFKDLIWNYDRTDKVIYLTFDDGPKPEVTSWVLEQLKEFDAKATFFCVGANIHKYSDLFQEVIDQGHGIGNHTFNHLNGWNTDKKVYLSNVKKCQNLTNSAFFRPPYGKITKAQTAALKDKYSIIMWDVLSGDFDPETSKETCLNNVLKNTREGSVVVFHDSVKAFDTLRYVLPLTLEYFSEKGYEFRALPQD